MNLYVNLTKFNEIIHEQIKISEFIYKFDEIDRIICEQIKINKLNINLTKLTKLFMSK